jgi:mannose-6-phosphate isomerase-like protein (cupin superfamily)
MLHLNGKELFATDKEGFRRRIIDDGEGPVRSYAYSPPQNGECVYHCHSDSVEIFLIVEGEGTIVVEGKEVQVSAPDVVIVEPGEFHLVRGGSDPLHMLAVVSPNLDDAVESTLEER